MELDFEWVGRMGGQLRCMKCGVIVNTEMEAYGHKCETPQTIAEAIAFMRREEAKQMANVVICDRDGRIVKSDVIGQCVYSPNPSTWGKTYVLCPSCAAELHQFLTGVTKSGPVMEAFDPDAVPTNGLPEGHHKDTTEQAIADHTADDSAYDVTETD